MRRRLPSVRLMVGLRLAATPGRAETIRAWRRATPSRSRIEVQGAGSIVRNNQVVATGGTTIFGAGTASYGIIVRGDGARVIGNDVISVSGIGSGASYGIVFSAAENGLASTNRITSADNGIYFDGGIAGKYRGNATSSVTTPYIGGTDAGNNN